MNLNGRACRGSGTEKSPIGRFLKGHRITCVAEVDPTSRSPLKNGDWLRADAEPSKKTTAARCPFFQHSLHFDNGDAMTDFARRDFLATAAAFAAAATTAALTG